MGGMSPVLESFLAGQQSQAGIIDKAQSYGLQKEHLDQMIKQFQVEMEHKNKQFDLQQQIHNLTREHDINEATQRLPEMLAKSPELAGTSPVVMPTITQKPGIGADNLPQNMAVPGISMQNLPPSPGTPITYELPYTDANGNKVKVNMNMPKSEGQSKIDDAVAVQKALLPGEVEKFKRTTGDVATRKLESQVELLAAKLADNDKTWGSRLETQKYLGELKTNSAETIAGLRTQMEMQRQLSTLFGPGMTDPAQMKDLINKTGLAVALGHEDINNVPAQMKGMINTWLQTNNMAPAPGGTKFRTELIGSATSADRLLNDFDQLDKEYPSGSNMASRLGNARGDIPFLGKFTDIGQRFKRYGDNIATYANMTGETPGMMRSPTLATKAESAAPTATDTATTRWNKKINTIDLALTKIDRGIGTFASKEQKISYWKDAIDQLQTLKGNYTFAPVLEKILQTGEYSPAMLNPLKK